MTWNIALPVVRMNQNTAPTDDGAPSEDAPELCGETDIAMAINYLTGVTLRPDTIHDAILGQGTLGISTDKELSGYLDSRCSTASTSYYPQPADRGSAMHTIRNYLFSNRLILVAQYFSATDKTPHWRLVTGGSGVDTWHTTNLILADSWDASAPTQDVATFWNLMCPLTDKATGATSLVMLGVDRTRDPLLP